MIFTLIIWSLVLLGTTPWALVLLLITIPIDFVLILIALAGAIHFYEGIDKIKRRKQ